MKKLYLRLIVFNLLIHISIFLFSKFKTRRLTIQLKSKMLTLLKKINISCDACVCCVGYSSRRYASLGFEVVLFKKFDTVWRLNFSCLDGKHRWFGRKHSYTSNVLRLSTAYMACAIFRCRWLREKEELRWSHFTAQKPVHSPHIQD